MEINRQEQKALMGAIGWRDWKFIITIIIQLVAVIGAYYNMKFDIKANTTAIQEGKRQFAVSLERATKDTEKIFADLRDVLRELKHEIKHDRYTGSDADRDLKLANTERQSIRSTHASDQVQNERRLTKLEEHVFNK